MLNAEEINRGLRALERIATALEQIAAGQQHERGTGV